MVKLYYSPSSAGAAAFLAAHVGGIHLDTEQVNMKDHITSTTGVDYYTINTKGTVPCLVLDDGTVLSDVVAVLAYIGSLVSISILRLFIIVDTLYLYYK
jgi:glutathione S-transferase